jgi:hypothetical protein
VLQWTTQHDWKRAASTNHAFTFGFGTQCMPLHRGTHVFGPDFGYAYSVRKTTPADRALLNLSCILVRPGIILILKCWNMGPGTWYQGLERRGALRQSQVQHDK